MKWLCIRFAPYRIIHHLSFMFFATDAHINCELIVCRAKARLLLYFLIRQLKLTAIEKVKA